MNYQGLQPLESVTSACVKLINVSWNLVQKHRTLQRVHDKMNDAHHRTANDNINLIVSYRKIPFTFNLKLEIIVAWIILTFINNVSCAF